jgi:hypothetical protein
MAKKKKNDALELSEDVVRTINSINEVGGTFSVMHNVETVFYGLLVGFVSVFIAGMSFLTYNYISQLQEHDDISLFEMQKYEDILNSEVMKTKLGVLTSTTAVCAGLCFVILTCAVVCFIVFAEVNKSKTSEIKKSDWARATEESVENHNTDTDTDINAVIYAIKGTGDALNRKTFTEETRDPLMGRIIVRIEYFFIGIAYSAGFTVMCIIATMFVAKWIELEKNPILIILVFIAVVFIGVIYAAIHGISHLIGEDVPNIDTSKVSVHEKMCILETAVRNSGEIEKALEAEVGATEERAGYLRELNIMLKQNVEKWQTQLRGGSDGAHEEHTATKPSITHNALILFIAAIIIPTAMVFAQTPDIRWYTKNPNAQNYQISTADELLGLARLVEGSAGLKQTEDFDDKTIILTKDIDLSGYGIGSGCKRWPQIGGEEAQDVDNALPFKGTFDGNGKTISYTYAKGKTNVRQCTSVTLFGVVEGTVKNLGVVGAEVGHTGGGIVWRLRSGSRVSNCYFTGTIDYAGSGIVNEMFGGRVANCYFAGEIREQGGVDATLEISGSVGTGGIVGTMWNGVVSNCYSMGKISGECAVGGIIGKVLDGGVTNCYSTAAISGTTSIGGIVGYVNGLVRTKEYDRIEDEVWKMKGEYDEKRNEPKFDEKELSNIFNKKSKAIRLFDTLITVISYNVGLNSSIKALGSKESAPLIVSSLFGKRFGGKDLNSSRCIDSSFSRGSRIIGGNDAVRLLSNNAAFSGMLNKSGNTMWDNRSVSGINGEDITIDQIKADGTLGGRFTNKNGWTVQNGKLPGLFGEAVEMPAHLK